MIRSTLFSVLAIASTAFGQTCNLESKCPEDSPCCSQYGQCGVGAYCLGGCHPPSSFSLDSCVPEPVCQSKKYTFENMDRMTSISKYLGDPSDTDWVVDGQAAIYDDNVLLTMPADSTGTVLASTTYMWYGKVTAEFKSSQGAGVVSAFILLSDVKDEIDYEFIGTELTTAQTNYYSQGVLRNDNAENVTLSNTHENYHTFEVDWTPDQITWSVDGQVGRTKKRSDTWNDTSNRWDFPQTPARVQLSCWPGGASTNPEGTIQWAGGPIDWESDLMKPQGYYYASFKSVEVQCYDAKSAPGTNDKTSYTYNNIACTNDTVVDGDKPTVLKTLQGTGTNMTAGESTESSSATSDNVPGRNGDPGQDSHGDSSSSTASSGSSSSSSSGSSGSSSGFSQGSGSDSGKKNSAGKVGANQEEVLKGSMFAGIVAVIAMMAL